MAGIPFRPVENMNFGRPQETYLCPNCNVLSLHILHEPTKPIEFDDPNSSHRRGTINVRTTRQHLIYQCVGCHSHTYFLIQKVTVTGSPPKKFVIVLHQFPVTNPSIHPSVPDDMKKATGEAERCLAVGAPNACGTMTRRAMSALCRDKQANGDDLYKQLLDLKERHVITPDLWVWAEELRIVGRSGAHPEWEDVSPDDAEYAVKFLREIIKYVYINPAERADKKLKETKKKKI